MDNIADYQYSNTSTNESIAPSLFQKNTTPLPELPQITQFENGPSVFEPSFVVLPRIGDVPPPPPPQDMDYVVEQGNVH